MCDIATSSCQADFVLPLLKSFLILAIIDSSQAHMTIGEHNPTIQASMKLSSLSTCKFVSLIYKKANSKLIYVTASKAVDYQIIVVALSN